MSEVRSQAVGATRRLVRLLLHVLLVIVPSRRQVMVTAYPRDEGNAVEVVRALVARYRGRIVWVDAPDGARLAALGLDTERIDRAPKRSARTLLRFVRSEAVFHTHGIFGCPRPVRGKAHINLWHGDGPKSYAGAPVPSSYLVSGSGVFGRRLAEVFGVDTSDLLLTGLPRTRQLQEPCDAACLTKLGIDPTRPFVVWMPTVRQFGAAGRNAARVDTTDPDGDAGLAGLIQPGTAVLSAAGIQVVVKPHPIDLVSRTLAGFASVSDADLIAAETTVYSFLGASAGLITDYSSVWTEYLALDRAIGFFTPDLEAYLGGRGVMPGSTHELPGPTLSSSDDFAGFAHAVLGGADPDGADARQRARETFELVHAESAADNLLDELARRGVLRVDSRPGAESGPVL